MRDLGCEGNGITCDRPTPRPSKPEISTGPSLTGKQMQTVASLELPTDSTLTVTMTMTVDEWSKMRDDIQSLLTVSIPLAEMALQLDGIIQKAQARL